MKNIIVMTVKLLAITLVAGLLLGVVNYVTREPIAEQEKAAADAARFACFPAANDFAVKEIEIPEEYGIVQNVYAALDADGNEIGVAMGITTKGFSAGLNLTVGISSDGKVTGYVMGSHEETPGLGAKASSDTEFISQFKDVPYDPALVVVKLPPTKENEIQAIAAATITSRGITDAVNTAAEFYESVIGGAR